MYKIALGFNVFHFTYFLVTTNIDLYPFNNIKAYTRQQRSRESFIHGNLMLFSVVAIACKIKLLAIAATVYLAMLLIGEFLSWWRYYFFGASKEWQTIYDSIFNETIKVLPPIKNHPIPNLEHCILHTITLLTFCATIKYLFL